MDSIFYGLFLLMLDVNVVNIDLSFIGYYLMYRGLKELSSESRHFAEIKPWAIAMGVYSGILFAASLVGVTPGKFGTVPVGTGATIIYLFVLYRIVQGVQDLENKFATQMEGALLMRRWKNVCIVQVALYFMNGLLSFKPIRLGIVSVVLTLAAFVLYILFLLTFHRSRQAYYAAVRAKSAEEEAAYTPYQEPEQPSESSASSVSAEPSAPTE